MVVANRHKPLIAQTFGHGGRPTLQLVARSFDFGQGIAEGNFLKQSPGDDAAQPVTVGRTVKRFGQKTADEHLSLELRNPIRLTPTTRSEEHTSELQSLMRISYAVFCLKKKKPIIHTHTHSTTY